MPADIARFPGPSVLIVCPGDMNYLRRSTIRLFRKLQLDVANDPSLDVYDYVTEKSEAGFNSWTHAQLQIPPPTDSLCRAVICFFGERIGTPLSAEVPLDGLSASPAFTRTQGPRAIRPGESATRIPDGFPLTGSSFEYLAAVEETQRRRLPVLLLVLADPTVLTKPALNGRWGNSREYDRVFKEFGEDRLGYMTWLSQTYQPQLEQLLNFVRYVSEEKGAVSFVDSEEQAMERVRLFLTNEVGLRDAERDVLPFKGLAPYDVDDWPILFGRREWGLSAISALTTLLERPDEPNLFHIVGGSGSGKSSLMRAALIGPVCHQSWYGDFTACVVRPDEIGPAGDGHLTSAAYTPVVARLCARALKTIDARIDDVREERALSRINAEFLVDEAIKKLTSALAAGAADPTHVRRLIVGIDQFEEIIDAVLTSEGDPVWTPLLRFMEAAAAEPRIVIVCTVQTNRRELMERSGKFAGLYGKGVTKEVFAPQNISDIVQKPFAFRRLTLEPKLEDALVKRIRDLFGPGFEWSVLPLISLTLTRLYAEWEQRRSKVPVAQQDAPGAQGRSATSVRDVIRDRATTTFAGAVAAPASSASSPSVNWSLRYDDYKNFVDIEAAIGKAADQALQSAKDGASFSWDDDSIASLLRRVVRIADGRLSFPSIELPGNTPMRQLAEALSERRLIAREGAHRFRLVHEAVVHHWTAAKEWLGEEQTLLEWFAELKPTARRWQKSTDRDGFLRTIGTRPLQDGATLLARWPDALGVTSPLSSDSDEALVRDFVLALLLHHGTPGERVESPKRTTTHVHLASSYGRTDIVSRFLEIDPSAATLTRSDGQTPLFGACWAGQPDLIEILLRHGSPANQSDTDGWLPIHAAATVGSVSCLRALAPPKTPDLHAVGAGGMTALHLTTMRGHLEATRFLLEDLRDRGRDVNAVADARGWTALHTATAIGDAEHVRLLLRYSADPRRSENLGWTPLHLAAQGPGNGEVTRLLLGSGAQIDARFGIGYQPLHLAAQNGLEASARVLLDGGASVQAVLDNGWTPLHIAVSNNRLTLARLLLQRGADLEIPAYNDWRTLEAGSALTSRSNPGWRSLHVAAARGYDAVASLLLECAADVGSKTDRGQTPLHLAVENGHINVVDVLINKGAPIDVRDASDVRPLDISVRTERFDLARLLIHAGAQVDAPNAEGMTLLDIAARDGKHNAVQFLLDVGAASADAVARLGRAPLHIAAEHGRDAVVNALLDGGVDVDMRDAVGWTAVHIAAQNGHVAVLRALVEHGANLRARARTPPLSPLQAAAETGQVESIRMLVEHGADVNDEVDTTRSPFYLAVRNRHFTAALVLLQLGADPRKTDRGVEPSVATLFGSHRADAISDRPSTDEMLLAERLGLDIPIPSAPPESAPLERARLLFAEMFPTVQKPIARSYHLLGAAVVDGDVSPWRRASDEFRAWLVREIAPIDGRYAIGPNTEIVTRSLAWYQRVLLLRVRDPEWRDALHVFYLVDEQLRLFRLNGTSPAIHEVNARAPVQLSESNVLDYLRFFCFFVRGEEGPFYVLEEPRDPLLSTTDSSVQAVFDGAAHPAAYDGTDDQGFFKCSAVLSYSNALFKTSFSVQSTGLIEMLDDEPIAADLPVKVEAPLT